MQALPRRRVSLRETFFPLLGPRAIIVYKLYSERCNRCSVQLSASRGCTTAFSSSVYIRSPALYEPVNDAGKKEEPVRGREPLGTLTG